MFKVFLCDANTNDPAHSSDIVYLELLDGQNSPLAQGKFFLRHSEGDGILTLPMEIPSGNYCLRSYVFSGQA